MANMSVAYRGPDPSLDTLTNELRAHYGNPARTYEYVTGYKSPSNYSGHNPDSNGVVHAVDIFTDDHGNIPQVEGRALAERLRLVGAATNRFSYLIHDMSAGAPQPMIAGQHTGWAWWAYQGADAHSDHIHLSIADGYWGDPLNVPAWMPYDTSRWGVTGASVTGQSSATITPIKEDELSAAEADRIMGGIASLESGIRKNLNDHFLNGVNSASGWTPGATKLSIENQRRINAANANIAALTEAVTQLAKGQGVTIDYKRIDASIKAALAESVVQVDVTVAGGK